MVTSISNASVRTTHHTGLFTDLGIKLSQLFFYKAEDQKLKLLSSIKLRLTIISFFFIGGVIGGVLYTKNSLHTLIFAATILVLGLLYYNLKFDLIVFRRKRKNS